MIFVNRNGSRWCDAPREHGPAQDPLQPLEAMGDRGVFARGGAGFRRWQGEGRHDRRDLPEGAPHGFEPAGEKGGRRQRGRLIGRSPRAGKRSGDCFPEDGRAERKAARRHGCAGPAAEVLHGGGPSQRDDTGAAALLGSLPGAEWLIADRGYDADRFREALKDKGRKPCILGRKSCGKAVRYGKRRDRIAIMFGRLKDWPIVGKTVPRTVFRPASYIATHDFQWAKTFLSAIAIATTILF
ncbi:hypothetical protein SAMN04488021_103102 [Paracoccus aminovorans]|uniref:Transposase DDE domain-containing protein n=1 Tax=Paracoccus aminovorans TaxID=34004 RepID=A0A1I2Y7B5_9RHOB|nr:IS5 family transposase [Paracoccus aminovorans]SFH21604.1 hypothetical protein SAMN04488021_103102 [Paracoccus aminovorans]